MVLQTELFNHGKATSLGEGKTVNVVWENLWHTDAPFFCYLLIQKA